MLEWSLFQDSEETIPSTEINDTSYESQGDFHWEKTKTDSFEKPNKFLIAPSNVRPANFARQCEQAKQEWQ